MQVYKGYRLNSGVKGAIVLCSGGLDSTVCAYYAKKELQASPLVLLFFDYGQRTVKQERKSVQSVARNLKARLLDIKLPRIPYLTGKLLTKRNARALSTSDLKNTQEEAAQWYVPQRNLIFLSYALSIAESLWIKTKIDYDIFVGFKHEGEEHYPDTTPAFVDAINHVKKLSSVGAFSIRAPFITKDKEDIVVLGAQLNVPLHKTYSCYIGKAKQCGACLACRLRQEGFYWANIKDTTPYSKPALRLASNKSLDL